MAPLSPPNAYGQKMETANSLGFEHMCRTQDRDVYELEGRSALQSLRTKNPNTIPISTPTTVELAEQTFTKKMKEFNVTIKLLERQITYLSQGYIPIKPREVSQEIDIINRFLAPKCTVTLQNGDIGTITRSVSPGRVYLSMEDGSHMVHTGPHLLQRREFILAKRVGEHNYAETECHPDHVEHIQDDYPYINSDGEIEEASLSDYHSVS